MMILLMRHDPVYLLLSAALLLMPTISQGAVKIEDIKTISSIRNSHFPPALVERIELDSSPFAAAWPRMPLAELEKQRHPASKQKFAAARLEESLSIMEYSRSRKSPQLSLRAAGGHYLEQTQFDHGREYNEITLGSTLAYPLLGSYESKVSGLAAAGADVNEKRLLLAASTRQELQVLRANYINYWCAAEQIKLGRAFLEHEEQIRKLAAMRTHTAHMLAADREEFMTAFAAVRRDLAVEQAVIHRSIRGMRLLTRPGMPLFRPQYPQLPIIPEDMRSWPQFQAALLENNPRLNLLRSRIEKELQLLEINQHEWLNGAVELGGYASHKDIDESRDYGVSMNINLDLPVSWRKARNAARAVRLAALKKAQAELEAESAEIIETAHDTFDHLAVYHEQVIFARQRLKASLESLREKILRSENLPGDMLEKLEQGRYDYYRIAMDYLEALRRRLQVHNRYIALLGEQDGTDRRQESGLYQSAAVISPLQEIKKRSRLKLDAVNQTFTNNHNKTGFYIWDSRQMLQKWGQEPKAFWQGLWQNEVNSLLVSLDAAQLRELTADRPSERQRTWHNFLQEAAANGLAIELLLGEPSWILPEHRPRLLLIIQQLQQFNFAGLHLDLEPNQLDEKRYGTSYLLAQLLRTVEEAAEVSRWPVSLSLHPRYLDQKRYKICLGCGLQNLELKEVALMIYTANPKRTAAIARPILARYPRLNFAVAQSVEPILSAEESYFAKGRVVFAQKMKLLQHDLPAGNFSGIYIQSYNDYNQMKP
ncbi:MAG: hypothetical protein CSB24_06690 [Deltaproteobacteria bacterium]|nr:MAG: hypothetical protein CSB24_06690 [Deltaproteobacteria bacterium]